MLLLFTICLISSLCISSWADFPGIGNDQPDWEQVIPIQYMYMLDQNTLHTGPHTLANQDFCAPGQHMWLVFPLVRILCLPSKVFKSQNADKHKMQTSTKCRQAQNADKHNMQTSTKCRQAQNADKHKMQTSTRCRQAQNADKHKMQTSTKCRQAQNADKHKMQTSTKCRQAQDADKHKMQTSTKCRQAHCVTWLKCSIKCT